jgi:hypothetical protein
MIKTQMGTPNISEMVAVHRTLCPIPSRNSNSKCMHFRNTGYIYGERPPLEHDSSFRFSLIIPFSVKTCDKSF